ncbi:DUF427 domain-containing protein [Streptacidiphilus sp. N1-12]|uniref:DUF427 domain-containing protein n=2 Tax=Streptacidiphilus alkalitolerans TaxID=3342712 RepID=A0ABV6WGN6_9ACTN
MTTNRGLIRTEPSAKRVRVYLGGRPVADSSNPLLVWESPHYPTYYFPAADVDRELLTADDGVAHSPSRGDAQKFTVKAGPAEAAGAALLYEESPIEELRGHFRFDWEAMDAWFEEDEEIFVHVRDPHTRIDVLPSSRHVRIEVDGVTVAESRNARLLFETGLPTRYYLPKTHVRMDLLERTDTVTRCPYKGTAEYWSIRVGDTVHKDLVWSYRTPLPESQKVAGLVAFYKVDIYVDGVLQVEPPRRPR